MPDTEDLYETLQVHPSAHPDVIQAAYRRLSFLYHPDRNPSTEATEMMKRLNHAYEILSDPDRRAAYDRTRGAQPRQRTETHSRDTRSEQPRTSRPTSQSRTTTPTTPPETRRGKGLRIMAGGVALAVVVAIVVATISADGGDGGGDGDNGGSRSVAFSPTWAPLPTTAPTPRPTAMPTRIPTPTFRPTARPRPTATTAPRLTATLRPTSTPTPAPLIIGVDYFTRGSSQDDVLHVQGTPTKIQTYTYEGHGTEDWEYGYSTVTFSIPGGRVTEWNDFDGNLKVRLLPKTGQSSTPGYFTRGSSQDDVLHAQGTPTKIQTYTYEGHGTEDWEYGYSTVTFSIPGGRVTEWNDFDGNLKVR